MTLQTTQQRIDLWIENEFIMYQQDLGMWWRQQRLNQQGRGTFWQGQHWFDPSEEPNHNDAVDDDKAIQYPDRTVHDMLPWSTVWPELVAGVVPCNAFCMPTDGRSGTGWRMGFYFTYTNADRSEDRYFRHLWFEGNQRGGVREWEQLDPPTEAATLESAQAYIADQGWRSAVQNDTLVILAGGITHVLTLQELIQRQWPSNAPQQLITDLINYLRSLWDEDRTS